MFRQLKNALRGAAYQTRQGARRRRGPARYGFGLERLEQRSLLSADTAAMFGAMTPGSRDQDADLNGLESSPVPSVDGLIGAGDTQALYPLSSLPELHSNPEAHVQLILDFDGNFEAEWRGYENVESPVFSLDADRSTFSGWELATIHEVWMRVAEDFAPFNIDVTTADSGSLNDGEGVRVVFDRSSFDWLGRAAGGVGTHGGFLNAEPNTVYVFTDYRQINRDVADSLANTASHEAGHAFGLEHQTLYHPDGRFNCYRPAVDGVGAIMGSTSSSNRSVWAVGTANSPHHIQDDVVVLTAVLGERADDHGDTVDSATDLDDVDASTVTTRGFITRSDDADVFRFSTSGGEAVFSAITSRFGANLVAQLELRNADGYVLALTESSDWSPASLSTSLDAGHYTVIVRSNGETGSLGHYQLTGSVTESPAISLTAPKGLHIIDATGFRHLVSWNAVDGAAGYRLFRTNDYMDGEQLVATLPAGRSDFIVTIPNNWRWDSGFYYSQYRVEAISGSTVETSSSVRPAYQFGTAYLTSDLMVETELDGTARLNWQADSNAVAQRIVVQEFLNQFSSVYRSTEIVRAGIDHTTVTDLTPGVRYRFSVEGINEAGAYSIFHDVVMPTAEAPEPAEILAIDRVGLQAVTVSWSPVPGATGYHIYRQDSRGTWLQQRVSAETTKLTVDRLWLNQSYRILIDTVGPGGTTRTVSDEFTMTPLEPSRPVGLSAAAESSDSVRLTWTDSSRETTYQVYQGSSLVGTAAADSTSFTVTGLTPSTWYDFRIVAVNEYGSTSSWWTGTRTLRPAPEAPTGLESGGRSINWINLRWNASSHADGYRIEVRLHSNESESTAATSILKTEEIGDWSTSRTIYRLESGTAYDVRIVAHNESGESATEWLTVRTTIARPSAVAQFRATAVDHERITLAWQGGQGADEFIVYQYDWTTYRLVERNRVDGSTRQFTVEGLESSRTHYFQIMAANEGGSVRSSWSWARTLAPPPPSVDNLTLIRNDRGQLALQLDQPASRTMYILYRSADRPRTWQFAVIGRGESQVTLTGLSSTDSIDVRFWSFSGRFWSWSDWTRLRNDV